MKSDHFPFLLVKAIPTSLAALLCMSLVAPAAALSLREMRSLESSSKQGLYYANYYLIGAMEGVIEAHDDGVRNGAKPTICLNGRRLEPQLAKRLYDAELKRNKDLYEADIPVQLVVANALKAAYSC